MLLQYYSHTRPVWVLAPGCILLLSFFKKKSSPFFLYFFSFFVFVLSFLACARKNCSHIDWFTLEERVCSTTLERRMYTLRVWDWVRRWDVARKTLHVNQSVEADTVLLSASQLTLASSSCVNPKRGKLSSWVRPPGLLVVSLGKLLKSKVFIFPFTFPVVLLLFTQAFPLMPVFSYLLSYVLHAFWITIVQSMDIPIPYASRAKQMK